VHNGWQKAQKVLWSEPWVEPLAECLPFFALVGVGKGISQHAYIQTKESCGNVHGIKADRSSAIKHSPVKMR
jgi:hypothetical protein